MAGYAVEVERPTALGRIDMVVKTRDYIYLLELKLKQNGGTAAAETQVREKHYVDAYLAETRPIISLAVEFDQQERSLSGWKRV